MLCSVQLSMTKVDNLDAWCPGTPRESRLVTLRWAKWMGTTVYFFFLFTYLHSFYLSTSICFTHFFSLTLDSALRAPLKKCQYKFANLLLGFEKKILLTLFWSRREETGFQGF